MSYLINLLDSMTTYISSLSPAYMYLALFLSSYIENVFPPIPGDTVVVFAAYFVGRSQQHYWGVFISTTIGSVAGFMTYYLLGYLIPREYFIRKNFRFLPARNFEKAGEWFQRYGFWIVAANRFLSGIRSVISIVAGLYRLPWLQVLALATVSCAIWNGLLIWAGYLLGANWRFIEEILRQYSRAILSLFVLLGAVWLARKRFGSSR